MICTLYPLSSCQHQHTASGCSGQDGTGTYLGSGDAILRCHIKTGLCCTEVKRLVFVTKPVKIFHMRTKIADFLSLLYHNLRTIYINKTKSLSLLQNLMGFFEIYGNGIPHSELKILAKI